MSHTFWSTYGIVIRDVPAAFTFGVKLRHCLPAAWPAPLHVQASVRSVWGSGVLTFPARIGCFMMNPLSANVFVVTSLGYGRCHFARFLT